MISDIFAEQRKSVFQEIQRCANILSQNVPHVTTQDVNIA
jgi:hypothetical protein